MLLLPASPHGDTGIVAVAGLHAYVPGLPRYGRTAIMPGSNRTEYNHD
jgi:hypothetical protein